MDSATDRIIPLDELDDFKVADGDPDVRGWDVLASDGRKIGEVDNLLVDATAMKVRYLDVDIESEMIEDNESERHVLIPIGYARLDEDDDRIFIDTLTSTSLGRIPAYTHEPITRDFETRLRSHFDSTEPGTAETTSDFYSGEMYDENRFFEPRRTEETERHVTRSEEEMAIGARERQTGEVDVRKRVETEHVEEQVPTRHEEVVVERRPADAMSAEGRIGEDEVRVPVTEEELVVEKRAVPKEEVVVRKQERIENEKVEADLRRERVDVRREGDADVREQR
ncbi:MAG: DUF2382 domain-containing protein [Gemmatimonadota bacterium]